MKALILALLCLGVMAFASVREQPIDVVIGDAAYNRLMPMPVADRATFLAYNRVRLEFVADLLETRDVSGWPATLRAERERNIARLRDYRDLGMITTNDDHPVSGLPCFLDRDGNLCAVAYLMARSDGMDLVRAVNERHQYATIGEMEMPEVDAWIAASGLTRDEVITIQRPSKTVDENGLVSYRPAFPAGINESTINTRAFLITDSTATAQSRQPDTTAATTPATLR